MFKCVENIIKANDFKPHGSRDQIPTYFSQYLFEILKI